MGSIDVRLKRLLALLMVVPVVALIGACGGSEDAAPSDDAAGDSSAPAGKVTITHIADLSGPTAETQVPYDAGAKAFFDTYNANLSDGQYEIEMDSVDDQFDPAKTLNAYKAAADGGDVAVLGPNSTSHAAMAQQKMTVPALSGIATLIEDAEYMWNLLPRFGEQAADIVEHGQSKLDGEPLRVAGLFLDVASGEEFGAGLKEATEAAGGTYLGDVKLAPTEAGGDWRAQAQALAEMKPNLIGVLSSAANPQVILPALDNAGLSDVVVGGVTPLAPYKENWTSTPENLASKFFVVSSATPVDIGVDSADEIIAAAEKIGEPDYANNIYFIQGWVAASVLAEAINTAEGEPTPESVNAAFSKINEFDTGGLNPTLCFSETTHTGTTASRPISVDLETGKFQAEAEFTANRSCE